MASVIIKVGSQLDVLLQFTVASSIDFLLYQSEKNPFHIFALLKSTWDVNFYTHFKNLN